MKTSIIGLGKIGVHDHLPALLESREVELDSVCDADPNRVQEIAGQHKVDGFDSVDELIRNKKPEIAVLALPHDQYLPTIEKLAVNGIHCLKEKPFAINLSEAKKIHEIAQQTGIKILVTLQRRYNPIFQAFEQLRSKIGRIFYFNSQYTLHVSDLENGWRASKEKAGGGCLIDMGYHSIDLLMWYFGLPECVHANLSHSNREGQKYDVEDTCSMSLHYGQANENGNRLFGDVFLSRVYPKKEEKLTVLGTQGSIELERMNIRRKNQKDEVVEELSRGGDWRAAFVDQIDTFSKYVRGQITSISPDYREHFKHVALIQAAYLSDQTEKCINPLDLLKASQTHL